MAENVIFLVMLYTKLKSLRQTRLDDFSVAMFGKPRSPAHLRDDLLSLIRDDEPAFLQRLPKALKALSGEAAADQRQLLDTQRGKAGAASERVYLLPRVKMNDGHAAAVLTFAPVHRDAQPELIATHHLARFILAGFVGTAASVTDERRRDFLADERGHLQVHNIPRPLPEDVIQHNVALFTADAQLEGYQLLGNNGWAKVMGHWRAQGEGVAWQAVMMVTTDIHSQDGLVLWVMARLPDYPEGFACLSLHAGEHPIPTADTINTFLAPLLLHPAFQRGLYIAQMYPQIVDKFGDDAPALTLNPEIRAWLRRRENKAYPRRRAQNICLNTLDKTAGYLLARLRKSKLEAMRA